MVENEVEDEVKKVDKQKNSNKVLRKKCPICGKLIDPRGVYMHFKQAHAEEAKNWDEWKSKFEDVWVEVKEEKGEEVSEGPIPTPKEELEQWFISQLEQKLQLAIDSKKVSLIVETLRDAPDVIWNPQQLTIHIKQLAGPRINDYLLNWLLTGLYKQLSEMRDRLMESTGVPLPDIPPFYGPQTLPQWPSQTWPQLQPQPQPQFLYMDALFAQLQRLTSLLEQRSSKPEESYVELPNPLGEGTIKVPASLIPLFVALLERANKQEELVEVPNPFGEGVMKVPASQAGVYMAIKAIHEQIKAMKEEKKEEKKEEQMVKVPNPFGAGEITVPASQVSMILAIGEMAKRIEKKEERKVRLPDGTELPVEEALFHMQLKSEQEKSKFLEEQLKTLQSQLVRLSQSTSTHISSPTLEFLNNLRKDFDDKVDKIITFLQLQADRQFQLQQNVQKQIPKYTPEERERKIKKFLQGIDRAKKQMEAEKIILESVKEKEEKPTKKSAIPPRV